MRANVNMMERMNILLSQVEYKNWDIGFFADGSYIQIKFLDRCKDTDKMEWQKGRKWLISEHMTDSEIVQTCFLAVKIAEEHEIREKFKFQDQTIFGPHFNAYNLAMAIQNGNIDEDVRVG